METPKRTRKATAALAIAVIAWVAAIPTAWIVLRNPYDAQMSGSCLLVPLIFVVHLVAILIGIPARREIKRTGESGEGMTRFAISLGVLGLLVDLYLVYYLFANLAIG